MSFVLCYPLTTYHNNIAVIVFFAKIRINFRIANLQCKPLCGLFCLICHQVDEPTSPFLQVYLPSPCFKLFSNSPSYLDPSAHSWTPRPCRRRSSPLWAPLRSLRSGPALGGSLHPRPGVAAAPTHVDSILTEVNPQRYLRTTAWIHLIATLSFEV